MDMDRTLRQLRSGRTAGSGRYHAAREVLPAAMRRIVDSVAASPILHSITHRVRIRPRNGVRVHALGSTKINENPLRVGRVRSGEMLAEIRIALPISAEIAVVEPGISTGRAIVTRNSAMGKVVAE